jgi:hypothetical protein
MLAAIRHKANQPAPQKTLLRPMRTRNISSAGRFRRSAASQPAWHNDASNQRTSSPGHSGDEPIKPPHNAHI